MGKFKDAFIGGLLIVAGVLAQGIPGVGTILGGILIASGIGMIRGTLFGPSIADLDIKFRANRLSMLDPIPMIYGERLVGGVIADYRVSSSDNKFLYIVLVLTHTPDNGLGIEAVKEVFLNGKFAFDASGATDNPPTLVDTNVSAEFSGKLRYGIYYGRAGQTYPRALNNVPALSPRWQTSAKGEGLAYIVLRLEADEEVYRGVPVITSVVQGAKLVDFRTGISGFTRNPMIHLRDYLASPTYGAGSPVNELDNFLDWEVEADHCDELTTVPDGLGGTVQQARYENDLVIDTANTLEKGVADILASTHGDLIWEMGKWRPVIRKLATPIPGVTFSEDQFVGDTKWKLSGLKGDGANSVNATYVDKTNGWAVDTIAFPEIGTTNPYLQSDSNFPAELAIELPGVTDVYRAIIMARMVLLELRDGDTITVAMREEALEFRVGQLVQIDAAVLDEGGPSSWWIRDMAMTQSGVIAVQFQRYNPDAYDVTFVPAEDIVQISPSPPTTGIGSGFGASNLAITVAGSCDPASLTVSATWDTATAGFVSLYRIRWRFTDGDQTWKWFNVPAQDVAQQTYVWDITDIDGTILTVELVAINSSGHAVSGKSKALLALSAGSWDTSDTVMLTSALPRPTGVIGVGDLLVREERSGFFYVVIDTSSLNGTEYELHMSSTSGFTPSGVSLVDSARARANRVALSGVPPVTPTQTFYWRVCERDCFSAAFGESDQCSAEFSDVYAGIATSIVSGDPCDNLLDCDSEDEVCLSGAGTVLGTPYALVDMSQECLSPGDVVSISADGINGGTASLGCNSAVTLCLTESGFIYEEDWTTAISIDPTKYSTIGSWAVQNNRLEVSSNGATLVRIDQGSFDTCVSECVYSSINGDNSKSAGAYVGTVADEDDGHGSIIRNIVAGFSHYNYGRVDDSVLTTYTSNQTGGGNTISKWSGISVAPEASTNRIYNCFGDLNTVDDPDWVLNTTDSTYFGAQFQPGLFSGSIDTGASAILYSNGHTSNIITIENLANQKIRATRFAGDTYLDGATITSGVQTGTGTLDLQTPNDGGGGWWDKVEVLSSSDVVEETFLAADHPSGKVWAGDTYTLNPAISPDCFASVRVEFLDASQVLISTHDAIGTNADTYTRFSLNNITIPANTAFIRVTPLKLGAPDCENVCVKRVMLVSGPAAGEYGLPKLRCGSALTTLTSTATATTVTQNQSAQISQGSTNIVPLAVVSSNPELYSASELESDDVTIDLSIQNLDVGDQITFAAEVLSSTGADDIRVALDWLDSTKVLLSTDTGNVVESATFAESAVQGVLVPASAAYVRMYAENLDGTESWQVRRRQLNRGPLVIPFTPPALRPRDIGFGTTPNSAIEIDYTSGTSALVTVDRDVAISTAGLADGVRYMLVFVQDGTGGHTVTVANVEWDTGSEPSYTTTANFKTIIELERIGEVTYARKWGDGFAAGSVSVTPGDQGVVVTTYAPAAVGTFTPANTNLVVTTYAPVAAQQVQPPTANTTLVTYEPLVATGIPVPAQNMTVTTYAPTLQWAVSPPVTNMTVTTYAPTITVS